MPYFSRHGTMKPPLGVRVNPEHPIARAHILSLLMNEGIGLPTVTLGSSRGPRTMTVAGSWTSNHQGLAFGFTTSQSIALAAPTTDDFPASAVTIAVIRRKRDTTFRQALFAYVSGGAAGNNQIGAHCPFSDGAVYWDYGANRLSVGGLSFSTTPERWIFTAGSAGSSIWQNGVKVASQSTAWTRTVQADILNLNYSPAVGGPDAIDLNSFEAFGVQWSDDLCRWWSAEPYAHWYAETVRKYAFFGASGSGGTLPSQLGLLGVG